MNSETSFFLDLEGTFFINSEGSFFLDMETSFFFRRVGTRRRREGMPERQRWAGSLSFAASPSAPKLS